MLSQSKKELLANWWNEGKLEASEEMGDLVSAAGARRRDATRSDSNRGLAQAACCAWVAKGSCRSRTAPGPRACAQPKPPAPNTHQHSTTPPHHNNTTPHHTPHSLPHTAGDKDFALKVYQQCGASGKIIVALAEKGDMAALSSYTGQTGQKLDYMHLLQVRCSSSGERGLGVRAVLLAGCLAGGRACWCRRAAAACTRPRAVADDEQPQRRRVHGQDDRQAGGGQGPGAAQVPGPRAMAALRPAAWARDGSLSAAALRAGAPLTGARLAWPQVPPPIAVNTIADLFLQRNMVRAQLLVDKCAC